MFCFSDLPPARPGLPRLMGIVNVTPDSFSGGTTDPAASAAHARQLLRDGAALLDLGAEASSFFRPGIAPVPPEEQLRRLLPVLELLRDLPPHIPLSIDTRSAQVAREILTQWHRRPADVFSPHPHSAAIKNQKSKIKNPRPLILNDISAGTHDPAMLPTIAAHGGGVILMHITTTYPVTPAADDPDILATVSAYLLARAQAAQDAGIPQHQIALDPGLGFGKTMPDNWRLALRSQDLAARLAPYPLLLGASRKRFLDTPIPPDAPLPPNWHDLLTRLTTRAHAASIEIKNQKSKIKNPPHTHPRDPASAALALSFPHAIHRLHNVALTATYP